MQRLALPAAALLILLATAAAFHNSFAGVFVFDDIWAIRDNPTLDTLWPLTEVLTPVPGGITVSGRPILNLSFALSYAMSGADTWGYHLGNLLIHALGALLLFGILRRVLVKHGHPAALLIATGAALLWAVHPLQTESVTYMVQRAESLSGLFFLLTFYGLLRGADSARPWAWYALAIGACLLGMGTKEIMAVAPVLALFFDRAFVAGSFVEAWRKRKWFYGALALTWIPLIWLTALLGNREGTAGFGIGVSPFDYALIQFQAIARYLWLTFWPHPLVLDYGVIRAQGVWDVLPYALVVLPLVVFTVIGLFKNRYWGFLGAWFFAILAPTSSFLPSARQTMAEHRMYLPLAAVLILAVLGLHALLRRRKLHTGIALAAWTVALCLVTVNRNEDYESSKALYLSDVTNQPGNAHAQFGYGSVLLQEDKNAEALEYFDRAIALKSDDRSFHLNRGHALLRLGRPAEAIPSFESAFRLGSVEPEAQATYAAALLQVGRLEEAVYHFNTYLGYRPDNPQARLMLAKALFSLGRLQESQAQLEMIDARYPGNPEVREYLQLIREKLR